MIGGKGFRIVLDTVKRIMRVKAWGTWDEAFVKKYQHGFTEKAEELREYDTQWSVVVDLSEYIPNSKDVTHMMHEHVMAFRKSGMSIQVMYHAKRARDAQPGQQLTEMKTHESEVDAHADSISH